MGRVTLLLLLIVALAGTVTAQQYRLDWLSINSGGLTEQSSTSFGAKLSLAQAIAGYCESSSYHAHLGFWYPHLGGATAVEEIETVNLPTDFSLRQNYPNPFNPTTTIEFALPRSSPARLEVYNLLGQMVTTLVTEPLQAGYYRVDWDGLDLNGRQVASGVYLYRLQAGDNVATRKMLLLK